MQALPPVASLQNIAIGALHNYPPRLGLWPFRVLLIKLMALQGHAGTVPMSMRRDPLVAAGRVIAKLEDLCRKSLENNNERCDCI
jgi:hypothetical protein